MPKTEALARLRTENAALRRDTLCPAGAGGAVVGGPGCRSGTLSANWKRRRRRPRPKFRRMRPSAPSSRGRSVPPNTTTRDGERRRQRLVEHRLECCPQCQGRLSGVHVGRRRQVVDLPPPPPVEVIEHQLYRGWCSYCPTWREAPLDLGGQVLGQGRMGVGIASL